MRPEYEPVTTREHIGYLVEECGEVLAAAGKTLRWGLHSVNPELAEPAETNEEWLIRECADLAGAVVRLLANLNRERGTYGLEIRPGCGRMNEPAKPLPLTDAEIKYWTSPASRIARTTQPFIQRCTMTIALLRRQVAELTEERDRHSQQVIHLTQQVTILDRANESFAKTNADLTATNTDLRRQVTDREEALTSVQIISAAHAVRIAELTARNAALVEALTEAHRLVHTYICPSGVGGHIVGCIEITDALAKAQEG